MNFIKKEINIIVSSDPTQGASNVSNGRALLML